MSSLTSNPPDAVPAPVSATTTSELNNLLQIISGTTELLENVWEGVPGSEKYLEMLRSSVRRAAAITAEFVQNAGGISGSLCLPVAPRAKAAEIEVEATKSRVLVVDDEPLGLDIYERFLTKSGFEVVTAGSGFDALDCMARSGQHFDVVLLDLTMPFMDGEETFRRMRAIVPELRVILTTGFIDPVRLATLKAEGLVGYLPKPLPPDEVVAEIERVLSEPEEDAVGIAAA